MSLKLTFLGTGTSDGIPVIGCDCATCNSPDPKDNRTRTSVWIHNDSTSILIDPGSDFREQALRERITSLDAILITHNHYDHIGGLNDIRPLNAKNRTNIDVYIKSSELEGLQKTYYYLFEPDTQIGGGLPGIEIKKLTDESTIYINGTIFTPLLVYHGTKAIYGFKFGKTAYITDAKTIPDETLKQIKNCDTLILNTLRFRNHSTHLNLQESLEVIHAVQPKRTWLVHLTHNLDHETLEKILPDNIKPAYDGLMIELKTGQAALPRELR